MSLSLRPIPSSAAQRGAASIQPAYFTSSLFVNALRADVQQLASAYSQRYRLAFLFDNVGNASTAGSSTGTHTPFALFKELWTQYGWRWLHFKVLEPRARETFLSVVLRTFLEFATQNQEVLVRIAGIFGLYTFYTSQPLSSIPKVHVVEGIPIPIDSLESLNELSISLESAYSSLKPYVIYILQVLHPKFFILPPLAWRAQKPPSLPREIVTSASEVSDIDGQRKAGRPSKALKAQRVRNAVLDLDKWLEGSGATQGCIQDYASSGIGPPSIPLANRTQPPLTLDAYRATKAEMMSEMRDADVDALDQTGRRVMDRLKSMDTLDSLGGTGQASSDGIQRLQHALMSDRSLLRLTDS